MATKRISRKRRTTAEKEQLRGDLASLANKHRPATVRQVFYLSVSAGLIAKTQREYKNTVSPLLGEARLLGLLDWDAVVDHTRRVSKVRTHEGIADLLSDTASFYRRDMWSQMPHRVEVWCEKQTLLAALEDVTDNYQVGLYPTRGFPSLTFLHQCATASRKPTFVYYFGDHDPSGQSIEDVVRKRLREFAPNREFVFERLAVTEAQVAEMGLETRPTKTTDSRAANFAGESVEVEAVPPDVLRQMATEAIERHIDAEKWHTLQAAESSERELLRLLPRGQFENMEVAPDPMGVGGVITPPWGQRDEAFGGKCPDCGHWCDADMDGCPACGSLGLPD